MARQIKIIDYDADNDIFFISDGEKVKASLDVGDFILDVSHKNLISGIEIMDASENLGINKDILKTMLEYFDGDKVGGVISAIKVSDPKNIIEKMQRMEYFFASFIRGLMSQIGTLHSTHGVLSLFRKDLIKELGGFDENNITEDLEMGMRLTNKHYEVRMCEEPWNYTKVPQSIRSLWVQRVRWFRGFIHNTTKYKNMIMNKEYGLLGNFQIPFEILTFVFVLTSVFLILYNIWDYLFIFYNKVLTIGWDVFNIQFKSFKDILFGIKWSIFFPTVTSILAGIYIYTKAHQYAKENWKFHFVSFIYLFIYPIIRSLQWFHAFILELSNAKRRWR